MPRWMLDVTGNANHKRLDVGEQPITIGRNAANVLVLNDNAASRAHAIIELMGGKLRLRDLNSSNGTFHNGRRVAQAELADDDLVLIGKTRVRVLALTEPSEETPTRVDQLSAADVVEEVVRVEDHERIDLGGRLELDYERSLDGIADCLPPGEFGEGEIALANNKGRIVHEASTAQRRPGTRREIVELFRLLLLCAFRSRTSDIHLEPRTEGYTARLRVDGTLVDACRLPHQLGVKLASVVKVLGEVDLASRDSIQEGSFSARVPWTGSPDGFRRVDYRASFAPTVFGQKLVLRVLDVASAPLKLKDLGLPAAMARAVAGEIANDAGMVLVAGPTGSGKTSTLYALVRSIDVSQRNVVTIEDPVEIQLEGVTQIPVDEEHDKTFSNILRSVLRQDPDVILVGEVRDSETARISMQAAITGHLVFSTVHTKDAAGTIFRLLDLGVEPYMISQGLRMVLAQRLVRTLCPECKRGVKPSEAVLTKLGPRHADLPRIFEPGGCEACLGTGHVGRRAVYELLQTTDTLKDVIQRSPTLADIQAALSGTDFTKLLHHGYDLAAGGLVSVGEVERAIGR